MGSTGSLTVIEFCKQFTIFNFNFTKCVSGTDLSASNLSIASSKCSHTGCKTQDFEKDLYMAHRVIPFPIYHFVLDLSTDFHSVFTSLAKVTY